MWSPDSRCLRSKVLCVRTTTHFPPVVYPVEKTRVFHKGRTQMDFVFLVGMFIGAGAALTITLALFLIATGKIDV